MRTLFAAVVNAEQFLAAERSELRGRCRERSTRDTRGTEHDCARPHRRPAGQVRVLVRFAADQVKHLIELGHRDEFGRQRLATLDDVSVMAA